MTFWQENYAFIKDVYDMRHQKMAEWMENIEKVSSIMIKIKMCRLIAGYRPYNGRQGLHLSRVQTRERQLPSKL